MSVAYGGARDVLKPEHMATSGVARGDAQGAGAPPPPFVLDTSLMLMYDYWLISTYLGKDIVCASKYRSSKFERWGCGHFLEHAHI